MFGSAYLVITITATGVSLLIIDWGRRYAWANAWHFLSSDNSFDECQFRVVPDFEARTFPAVKHPRSMVWWFGLICQWLATVIAACMVWVAILMTYHPTPFIWLMLPATGVMALCVRGSYAGRKLCLKERRRHAPVIASPDELASKRYVLYLRTLDLDCMRAQIRHGVSPGLETFILGMFFSGCSEEEDLAEILRPIAPMVAVGIPGENLRHAGATRFYLPNNGWKKSVSDLILNARLIVIMIGRGESTIWEIVEAMATAPPQRLMLIVSSELSDADYKYIRGEVMRKLNPRIRAKRSGSKSKVIMPRLPTSLDLKGRVDHFYFIYFSAHWYPFVSKAFFFSLILSINLFTKSMKPLEYVFRNLHDYESGSGREIRANEA